MGGGKIEINRIENSSNRLIDILDRYEKQSGKRLWDAKHYENLSNEIDRIKKENDRMEIELRQLMGEDITSLHYKELIEIEKALENGLVGVRDKQIEIVKMKDKNFLARMQMPEQEEENDQEAEQEEEEEQAHYEPMAGYGDPLAVDVSSVMLQQLISCFDNHLELASTTEEKVDQLQASHDRLSQDVADIRAHLQLPPKHPAP